MAESCLHSLKDRKYYLPRLAPVFYQGDAVVHWEMSMAHRKTGWLTPSFHYAFRELMLHAASRHHLICPVYCLMPDHLHFIWMGLRAESNQLDATAFVRTYLKPLLARVSTEFQHQAFDHVLRDEERRRNAFAMSCTYILENPVRAGLVKRVLEYEFCGAVVQSYPKWHPCDEHFWRRFWEFYRRVKDPGCEKIRRPLHRLPGPNPEAADALGT